MCNLHISGAREAELDSSLLTSWADFMAKRKNQPKKSREAKEGAFDASAQVMTSGVSDFSSDTKNWIFNAADEMAAQAGMIFDGQRGQFTCDWIESNCYLWQGEGGGQPMKLI